MFSLVRSCRFQQREYYLGKVPLKEDYRMAEQMVIEFSRLQLSKQLKKAFWNDVLMNTMFQSRTLNALPSFEDLETVADIGMFSFYQRATVRDEAHMKAHGRCLDNIMAGPSTLPQAGRGAFATRFLPKNSIITGSPLLIVAKRSHLYMYGSKNYETNPRNEICNTSDFIGHQLLLNYCMGNSESPLLLCPYGSTVNYINHNQTRANVRLQWPEHGVMSHNVSYLDLNLTQMDQNETTNLAIDYVAVRDIEPGEELFLDYGDAFEDAWKQYLESWNSHEYCTADAFNDRMKGKELKTHEEQRNAPYPFHLQMECHYTLKRRSWRSKFDPSDDVRQGYPCDVLSRNITDNGDTAYSIRILYDISHDNYQVRIPAVREGVPREAIQFVEKMTVPTVNAFRHEIGIPDEIFPTRWKSIR